MTERAISQSLGFVLIFSIIILSVGLLSTVGYDQIEAIRDAEQLENAERSFVILGQNIEELQDGRSVARSGELDLDRGDIAVIPASESTIRVEVNGTSGPPTDYAKSFPMSGVRYRLAGSTVGYESGALFRADRKGIAVQNAPTLLCSADSALVSIVTIDGPEDRQLSAGTVSVTVERNTSEIAFPVNRSGENSTEGRANVTLSVTDSPFTTGWEHYFADQPHWHKRGSRYVCDGSGNGVSSYRVVQTRINITFTR